MRCASGDVEDLLELHKQPQVVVGQLAGDDHTAGTRREKRRGIRRFNGGVREWKRPPLQSGWEGSRAFTPTTHGPSNVEIYREG